MVVCGVVMVLWYAVCMRCGEGNDLSAFVHCLSFFSQESELYQLEKFENFYSYAGSLEIVGVDMSNDQQCFAGITGKCLPDVKILLYYLYLHTHSAYVIRLLF